MLRDSSIYKQFLLRSCAVVFAVLLWCVGSLVFAQEKQRVYDEALLFTEEETTQLEASLSQFCSTYNMDAAVVTTDDARGKTSRAYADDFYDEYEFGTGEDASGALFLIDMDNREIYVSTCGSMIDYLTDARIELVLDAAFPFMKTAEYSRAADAFVEQLAYFAEQGIPEGQFRVYEDEVKSEESYLSEDEYTVDISDYTALDSFLLDVKWFFYEHEFVGELAIIALVFGLITALIFCITVVVKYHFKFSTYSYPFRKVGTANLTQKEDVFICTNVVKHKIETSSGGGSSYSSSSGSSGSSSSVHSSSSGQSHGGGGRSF